MPFAPHPQQPVAAPPALRPRCPHQVLHFLSLDGGLEGEDDSFLLSLAEGQQSLFTLENSPTEEPWGLCPLPSALLELKPTGTHSKAGLSAHQLPPARVDLTEVGADVDVVKANVPVIAVHVGEAPVDGWLRMCHLPLQGSSPTRPDTEPPTNQGSLSTRRFWALC